MTSPLIRTPVALILFNRPETTLKVLDAIRPARPPMLFVIADGPRANHPSDAMAVAAARAVIDQVDWPCEIIRDSADTNLGCRHRVASGLTRVFEAVEQAIILEDDCVPHPTFFPYCEALLEHWHEDERVCAISGVNYQNGRRRTPHSYYFSRYAHVSGWASWRRAWRHYDDTMRLWPEVRDGGWLADLLGSQALVHYWTERFQAAYTGAVDSWAFRWALACWLQNGLAALPNVNLVSHIGYGPQATHTFSVDATANLPTHAMSFPLDHPPHLLRDAQADAYTDAVLFPRPNFVARVRRRLGVFARRVGLGRFTRLGRMRRR